MRIEILKNKAFGRRSRKTMLPKIKIAEVTPPPLPLKMQKANYSAFLLPSVAQPPLALQLFLPLQPLSPVLQPPLPLQEFCPLQACLSFLACQMVPEDCPAM